MDVRYTALQVLHSALDRYCYADGAVLLHVLADIHNVCPVAAGVIGRHAAGVPAYPPVHWLDVLAGQQADAQHARGLWGAR